MSRPARELVSEMLKYDPAARITAEKALTHGWLAGRDAADKALKARAALLGHSTETCAQRHVHNTFSVDSTLEHSTATVHSRGIVRSY